MRVSDGPEFAVDAPRPAPPPGPSLPDPLINMVIDGRYRVVSRMARGGMASVYVARDDRLDRLVALKVMHPHLAESEQFTARFRREARSAAKISHPGVVPIFDQGVVEGQGYLVMELVDGPDLRTFLATSGPLTLGLALDFTGQVLDALSAAHRAGVVHRDLKPENVLVDRGGSLRIVDFGLARAASEVSMSTTGTLMGTVAYLAPEVALEGSSDARTDIFAVGVMLYEMLTGSMPGQHDNPVQMALARVNNDIPPPSESVPWLPVEVDNLVGALCARNPAERPASALDAAAMVRHTRSAIPQEITDRSLPGPVGDPSVTAVRDMTIPVGHQGRTAILPIEQMVVQTSGSVVAPQDRRLPLQSRHWLIIITVLMLVAAIALGIWWWWQAYGPGSYIQVPDFQGQTVEEAEATLAQMQIASFTREEFSDDVAEGLIIATDPAAGQRSHRSEEIGLIVSQGIRMLTVPQVTGWWVEDAEEAIREADLSVGERFQEWSDEFAEGQVIWTDPAGDTEVPHNTPVNLTVSLGRQPLDMPQTVGVTRAEAEQVLSDLGLSVTVTEEFSDAVPEGSVISQIPAVGSTLYRGDPVSLVVSKGPEEVVVPDVSGRTSAEATTILEEAGFTVEVNKVAGFFDTVGSQSPSPGAKAKRGTTVTIVVV